MSQLDRDRWPALFPERSGKSPDEIGRRMVGLAFTQNADPHTHFKLLAPIGFRWREPAETAGIPGLLVSVVDRDPPSVEIAVLVDHVPREVSPAEWTLHRLERAGHTLWASRQADTPIGVMAEFLTRTGDPSGGVIARTAMAKDGQRIFTITCQARAEEYEKWASDFCVTLASFKLLEPERRPLAEELASFMYLYPSIVGFSYPASWSLVEETLSDTECHVHVDHPDGGAALGAIHLSALAGVRPGRMIGDYFARLEREGVRIEARSDPAVRETSKGFEESSVVRATGTRSTGAVEIEALTFSAKGTTLLLASAGPTRAERPVEWMVQRRALMLARETIYAV